MMQANTTLSPSQGHDRRITRRLLLYWMEKRGERDLPCESDIVPSELTDIWDSCFLVRVDEENAHRTFRFSYMGKELIEAYGDDLAGYEVCENLVDLSTNTIALQLNKAIQLGEPVIVESEFKNKNNILIRYRQCLLPLESEEGKTGYVLGGMRWRGF